MKILVSFALGGWLLLSGFGSAGQSRGSADFWLTDPDHTARFTRQSPVSIQKPPRDSSAPTIRIHDDERFQTIDGFGYTLTGGSAMLLQKMEPSARKALLQELFEEKGIGVSYLRISIGASDLDAQVFSYDDLPAGDTDVELKKFSLAPDRNYLIPVLKQILAIQPKLKIMGSPWSPPVWMKTNQDSKGGSLKPEYYDAYARYLVKYIQEMKREGIRIDALTIQNEPLHPGNNPSLLMLPEEQAAFIKSSLGPIFQQSKIGTHILIYDHNADRPDYPVSILNDPAAKKYVYGSAFHLYGGEISALSQVHKAHPDKHLYFTEQWIGAPGNLKGDLGWHVENLIIGATRNWCRTVLEWNLAATPDLQPHTPGGCTECLGALTLDGNTITRNPAYYIIAHASKFVRPGSVRLESNLPKTLPNVAFKTPAGKTVCIVLNTAKEPQSFWIRKGEGAIQPKLNSGAVGTFVW